MARISQDLIDKFFKCLDEGMPPSKIYKLYPQIPEGSIYYWIQKYKEMKVKENSEKLLPLEEFKPVVKAKPGPKPGAKKPEPIYQKVELETPPPPPPPKAPAKKKNIVLVCSEDPQAILDVLKGMI